MPTKFCKISTNYLSYVLPLSQTIGGDFVKKFGAFSEYMNFIFQSTKKLKNMYHRKQNLSFDAPLYKLRFKRPEFDKHRHPNNNVEIRKRVIINKSTL